MAFFYKLKIDNKVSKSFSYEKGDCKLSFNLRVDIKPQLNDFLELLKVAEKEVMEELNK